MRQAPCAGKGVYFAWLAPAGLHLIVSRYLRHFQSPQSRGPLTRACASGVRPASPAAEASFRAEDRFLEYLWLVCGVPTDAYSLTAKVHRMRVRGKLPAQTTRRGCEFKDKPWVVSDGK